MTYLEYKKEKGQAERGTKKICTGLRLQTPSKVFRLLVGSHSFNHLVNKDTPLWIMAVMAMASTGANVHMYWVQIKMCQKCEYTLDFLVT